MVSILIVIIAVLMIMAILGDRIPAPKDDFFGSKAELENMSKYWDMRIQNLALENKLTAYEIKYGPLK